MLKSNDQIRQELYSPYKTEDLIQSYKSCKIGLEKSIKNNDSGGIVGYGRAVSDLEKELGERGINL